MQTSAEAPLAEPRATPAKPGAAAVATRALGHSFGALEVIERLDLRVEAQEVVGIVGPSGCGKSTLLELVSGLAEPTHGEVSVDGAGSPEGRLRSCAYMPQRDLLLPWLAAIDNAGIAVRNRGESRAAARALAAPLFDRVGLGGFEAARPTELSGGMPQRL